MEHKKDRLYYWGSKYPEEYGKRLSRRKICLILGMGHLRLDRLLYDKKNSVTEIMDFTKRFCLRGDIRRAEFNEVPSYIYELNNKPFIEYSHNG